MCAPIRKEKGGSNGTKEKWTEKKHGIKHWNIVRTLGTWFRPLFKYVSPPKSNTFVCVEPSGMWTLPPNICFCFPLFVRSGQQKQKISCKGFLFISSFSETKGGKSGRRRPISPERFFSLSNIQWTNFFRCVQVRVKPYCSCTFTNSAKKMREKEKKRFLPLFLALCVCPTLNSPSGTRYWTF